MTLIICLFILFLYNRTFLNLLQQPNVAVVDGLTVLAMNITQFYSRLNIEIHYDLQD